jgi:hypothetical protein
MAGGWHDNAIMEWDGVKVTDHGRAPLSQGTERFGVDKRMSDATLRRQHIAVKRQWSTSWENLPSTNNTLRGMKTADGGMAGEEIEAFYHNTPGKFRMVLRRGTAINKPTPNPAEAALPYEDEDFYIVNVMLTEFSKEIRKRGLVDLWSANVTLEEV